MKIRHELFQVLALFCVITGVVASVFDRDDLATFNVLCGIFWLLYADMQPRGEQ